MVLPFKKVYVKCMYFYSNGNKMMTTLILSLLQYYLVFLSLVFNNRKRWVYFPPGSKSIRDIIIKALVDNPKWYMASETEMPYLVDMLIENGVEDSILEYAVSKGVDPNRVLLGKDSPLMKAITKQRYKISCVLIEAGADVTYANADGTKAFDIFSGSITEYQ